MVVVPGDASALLGAAYTRSRSKKSAWRGFTLLCGISMAVMVGGAALAIWRSEARQRSGYILAAGQCRAASAQAAGSPAAAAFWCLRARQLRASLGEAAAEALSPGPLPAGPLELPSPGAAEGPTARELAAARAAAMWDRLDGR